MEGFLDKGVVGLCDRTSTKEVIPRSYSSTHFDFSRVSVEREVSGSPLKRTSSEDKDSVCFRVTIVVPTLYVRHRMIVGVTYLLSSMCLLSFA